MLGLARALVYRESSNYPRCGDEAVGEGVAKKVAVLGVPVSSGASMPLSRSERRALTGPAVVGSFAGALAALALAGLHSEYQDSPEPLYPGVTHWLVEALVTWILVAGSTVLLFGLVPVVIARMLARRNRSRDV